MFGLNKYSQEIAENYTGDVLTVTATDEDTDDTLLTFSIPSNVQFTIGLKSGLQSFVVLGWEDCIFREAL